MLFTTLNISGTFLLNSPSPIIKKSVFGSIFTKNRKTLSQHISVLMFSPQLTLYSYHTYLSFSSTLLSLPVLPTLPCTHSLTCLAKPLFTNLTSFIRSTYLQLYIFTDFRLFHELWLIIGYKTKATLRSKKSKFLHSISVYSSIHLHRHVPIVIVVF